LSNLHLSSESLIYHLLSHNPFFPSYPSLKIGLSHPWLTLQVTIITSRPIIWWPHYYDLLLNYCKVEVTKIPHGLCKQFWYLDLFATPLQQLNKVKLFFIQLIDMICSFNVYKIFLKNIQPILRSSKNANFAWNTVFTCLGTK
jgi:hypothetical protein